MSVTTTSNPSRTLTAEDHRLYGGDCAITDTVPAFHPKLHVPLPGTRESIKGAGSQYRTFFRGDVINVSDGGIHKAEEFNFILWNDDGSPEARRFFMTLKLEKGFRVCKASDWELHPDLEGVYEVEGEQIVLRGGTNVLAGGVKPCYEVLMFRTKKRFREEMAKNRMAPQPLNVMQKNETDIAGAISDQNVSVLQPQVEAIEHRWTPD